MARPDSSAPGEIVRDQAPPPEVKRALSRTETETPCGMPFTIIWRTGPKAGLPVSAWCAEPLCLRPGLPPGPCTGPRFVPHPQQYTTPDPADPARRQRVPDARECVEAAVVAGEKATSITGVKDTRSRQEIAHHIALTWQRMRAALVGGGWGT